jgi:uncharacterized iron-regulated membrane protein
MSRLRPSPRALKLLWDAHSAIGVAFGIGLFVIFYAGAFSLLRADLMAWSDPVMRAVPESVGIDEAVLPVLEARPPMTGADVMIIHPYQSRPFYWVRYAAAPGDTVDTWISGTSGALVPPRGRSKVSEIPYKLHYFAQAGLGGRLLSGLLGVLLLYGVVTGLLIHLHKLPRDWHTFRHHGGLRTTLADGHAVLGLVGLPFTVLFALTGAFFSLLILVLGPTALVLFDGDSGRVDEYIAGLDHPTFEASGVPAPMLSPEEVVERLGSQWKGVDIALTNYTGWGDVNAFVAVQGPQEGSLSAAGHAFVGAADGRVLADRPPEEVSTLGATVATLTNLHFAHVGGRWLDALFFVLSLGACAVILTGNVLWLALRRRKAGEPTPRLHAILARTTVGVSVGLVAALPLLLLVSRLIPLEWAGRQVWEDVVFFGGWALLAAVAFTRAGPRVAAGRLCAAAAALSLAAAVANGALTGAWPWVAWSRGMTGTLAVDGVLLASAVALAWTGIRMGGLPRQREPAPAEGRPEPRRGGRMEPAGEAG